MHRWLVLLTMTLLVPFVARCPGPGPGPGPKPTTTTTTAPVTTTVQVFFTPNDAVQTDCGITAPVTRDVTGDPLTGALRALLAGPTEQEKATLGSWFSAATADALRSVTVVDRVARVDFTDLRTVIPNASTSCGSAILLGQLDATVTQFPDVDRALYSINGDAETFYSWLQLGVPE